jgi:hypothetical protein
MGLRSDPHRHEAFGCVRQLVHHEPVSLVILAQLSIAVSVGGRFAPFMLGMRAGTSAFSSLAKKVAKVKAIVDGQYC